MSAMDLSMKGSYLEATTQAQHRSGESFGYACNFVQFGHATLSIFALQLWVILLCNKHSTDSVSLFYLPRHSSFTINHTFVNLGKTRHNMAESLVNTTFSTTKGHRHNRDKGKCVGNIP